MKRYRNTGGNSGIESYKFGDDWIEVKFRGSGVYGYNYMKPGRMHVEQMKLLAENGSGLNSYINRNVNENYAYKK